MCVAAAAQIPGTIVAEKARPSDKSIHPGNPSSVLAASADVEIGAGATHAISAETFPTRRRIMEGFVVDPRPLHEGGQ